VFFTVADRSLYLRLVRENQEEAGVGILAYCLMTNHVHFVAIPEREDSLAVLFGRANGRYAQAINIRKRRCGHLWQARFHSCALSDTHLEIALRYVEDNPCRAGMAGAPGEYGSSSPAHLLGGPDRSRILDLRFWERTGGASAWAELHATRSSADQIMALRKCTYSGRPLGQEPFLAAMEERFHRKMGAQPRRRTAPNRENSVKSSMGCPKMQITSVATQAVPRIPKTCTDIMSETCGRNLGKIALFPLTLSPNKSYIR
jgi:putative transposase